MTPCPGRPSRRASFRSGEFLVFLDADDRLLPDLADTQELCPGTNAASGRRRAWNNAA